jgi:AcrR family transcriptional regulator
MPTPPSPDAMTAARHGAVLDAALATFARFGFRKTSMDDIARAAGLSRQALYDRFTNKEDLFRAAMKRGLEEALSAAKARLASKAPIEERLVGAMDEWLGRYLEALSADASDLYESSRALLGNMFSEYGVVFERELASAVSASRLASFCEAAGVSPEQLAATLHACGRGWKHKAKGRAEFVSQITIAVRLFCRPPRRSQ